MGRKDDIPPEVREQFEDYAYRNYEAARMALALTGKRVKAKMDRPDYLKRDAAGAYENAAVALTFVGWKLCLDAQAEWLSAATLWKQWADVQDRVLAQIPLAYTIALCMEKEGFYVGLSDPQGEAIEYDDPADLDEVGSFVKIIDAALAAAVDHYKRSLN
jgi:hypothetical protein